MAFGRKKKNTEEAQQPSVAPELPKGYTPGKGAPTPKRKTVEARNRKPIIADTKNMTRQERTALRNEERARSSAIWEKEQKALKTGDIANMPLSHRGEERAFARDALDSRRQVASWMIGVAIILIIGMFALGAFAPPHVFNAFVLTIYAILILMLVEAWWKARQVRALVRYKYGVNKVPMRLLGQLTARAFTPRRFRLPRPRVKIGEYPRGGNREDMKIAIAADKARNKN